MLFIIISVSAIVLGFVMGCLLALSEHAEDQFNDSLNQSNEE